MSGGHFGDCGYDYYKVSQFADEFVDGSYRAKYPEKETEEFQDATWRTTCGYTVNLAVEFDTNGNPTFEVVKNG